VDSKAEYSALSHEAKN